LYYNESIIRLRDSRGDREMKARIARQQIEGYYGQDTGKGRWLFVRGIRSKGSYPVARVVDGEIVELDNQQALRDYTNQEIAEALIAAEAAQ
jgi:hypothetical protein